MSNSLTLRSQFSPLAIIKRYEREKGQIIFELNEWQLYSWKPIFSFSYTQYVKRYVVNASLYH